MASIVEHSRSCVICGEQKLSLHSLPRNEEQRSIWLKFIFGRPPKNHPALFICSNHFHHSEFTNYGLYTSGASKLYLKPGAVPTRRWDINAHASGSCTLVTPEEHASNQTNQPNNSCLATQLPLIGIISNQGQSKGCQTDFFTTVSIATSTADAPWGPGMSTPIQSLHQGPDAQQVLAITEEVLWRSSLEPQEMNTPHIKEEDGISHQEETDTTGTTLVTGKTEDEEKPLLPLLHPKVEDFNEAEASASSSSNLIKTETDGEDCGRPDQIPVLNGSTQTCCNATCPDSPETERDFKTFNGTRTKSFLALVPEHPQDSDADLTDEDDPKDDLDFDPTESEDTGDTSFESSDEEEKETRPTGLSCKTSSRKKRTKEKNSLKRISMDTLEPSSPSGPHRETLRIWRDRDIDEFEVPISTIKSPDTVKTPFQYFKMLFTDQMIEHIVQQTNLYSVQKFGESIRTSVAEIENFLSILLFMGVFRFPAMEDYWNPESRYEIIADIMSWKRFRRLRRFIHFNDNCKFNNSWDRFYKIRPLFEMLREQCLLIPSTYLHSVNEVMVAHKGARVGTPRQCKANQSNKWGFKLFCRASPSGIIHDLLIYQGSSTLFNVALSEQEQALPPRAQIVTTLCKTIIQPQLSVVFCDVASFKLIDVLQADLGVRCTGTVRSNHIVGAPLLTDEDLMKTGPGTFDYILSDGVIAVKWFDNKCVHFLSNAFGVFPVHPVKKWSKKAHKKIDVLYPSLVHGYNQNMAGIFVSDMLVNMYKTPAKSRRWYFPLFGYMLDLCISNSWLIYKRDCGLLNEKPMSLKRFRLAVAHSLKKVSKAPPLVRRPSSSAPAERCCFEIRHTSKPSQPQPDVRYDNCGHLPLHCKKRGRCNFCPKGVSRWKCQKCDVFLCLHAHQQCFVGYHQKPTRADS